MHRRTFTNVHFAYWLQGALEIANLQGFSDAQVQTIRRRINDVENRDPDTQTIWLMLALSPADEAFPIIKQLQYEKFLHDIDPTYAGNQEFLCDIHDGKVKST